MIQIQIMHSNCPLIELGNTEKVFLNAELEKRP
jgi:hypothetical protein